MKQSTRGKKRLEEIEQWEENLSDGIHWLAKERDKRQVTIMCLSQMSLCLKKEQLEGQRQIKITKVLEGDDDNKTKVNKLEKLYKI